MAEDLYELYAGLLDQQIDLAEEAVIGIVRAAFGDLSIDFKRHLRSLVPPRCGPLATSVGPQSNLQQITRAQEEIETARDFAQRQIATALANGFGALANFPSALGTPASQPPISGSSNQATVGANEANNNADNSDDDSMSIKSEDTSECESDFESHSDDETEIKEEAIEEDPNEIAAAAGTPNSQNTNNDNVSVKTEIESECDSSDSESSEGEEEYELTVGREIKEEIGDGNSNDHIIGNSVNETGQMNVMEEEQEDDTQFIDNTNDYNFETVHSQLVNSNLGSNEQLSDAVVNYEEFDIQSIGSPNNQETVDESSLNEESMNIAIADGEFVEIAGSNEIVSEQDQAGPSIVSNTTSTSTRRTTQVSARIVDYSDAMENSLSDQQGISAGTRKGTKRTIGRSGKSKASKRSRVEPTPNVIAEETDNSESEEDDVDDPAPETIPLSVIVRRLKCRVPGCKKVFSSKEQFDDHLLAKHAIEKYACKVKDCTESYATSDELTTHRNSVHDNLDNEWPCGQCEVTCLNYHYLCTHILYYHEYGLFACSADKCDFTEKTRIKVQTHQLKHRPAKYRCTYAGCTSAFNKSSNLTTHLRVHSQEKPFLCSHCPKAFARKNTLTRHERVHSGLKPYSCTWPHCDYSSSDQSTVLRHIRCVHYGLPETKKEQKEKGIIDNRDARLFVKKSTTNSN